MIFAHNDWFVAEPAFGGKMRPGQKVVVSAGKLGKKEYMIVEEKPFANGRTKAEAYLNQKMKEVGLRVENDGSTSFRDYKVGDELRLRGRYGVITKMNASQVTLDIDGEFYTAPWNDPQLKE